MADEFKLKSLDSLSLKPGDKLEVEVEGINDAKVLLVNAGGKIQAVGPKCTHYGAPLATAAADPAAVVVNSFSKYFSMTGWRVGWTVLPEDLVRPVECLAQNLFISAPHIAQVAAEAAFDCAEELDANVARYRRSRELLVSALPGAGFPKLAPAEGAFYLYADVGDRTNDSAAFCARMLAECGIAASSGLDFDRGRGNRTVRFSYCGPEADMAEAAQRLASWR